ncbi:hypothetical protein EBQ91_00270 [bacterium]|jgi:hypothetical protein|nr:hypothetical protein [bacterium]
MDSSKQFVCEICDFHTTTANRLEFHMKTKKHQKMIEKNATKESPQEPIEDTPQEPATPQKKKLEKPIAIATELHPETDFLTELNTNYTQSMNYSYFIKNLKFDSYKYVLSILDIKSLFCNKWKKMYQILYSIFVNIILVIPYERRPIHIFKTPDSHTSYIWYIKENNKWYQLNGVSPNHRIKMAHEYTPEVYYLIIKPMLLKFKNAWLNHAQNLYVVLKPGTVEKPIPPENLKEKRFTYALCGQILCKYDTIFERMYPKIPESIKDILIKNE